MYSSTKRIFKNGYRTFSNPNKESLFCVKIYFLIRKNMQETCKSVIVRSVHHKGAITNALTQFRHYSPDSIKILRYESDMLSNPKFKDINLYRHRCCGVRVGDIVKVPKKSGGFLSAVVTGYDTVDHKGFFFKLEDGTVLKSRHPLEIETKVEDSEIEQYS